MANDAGLIFAKLLEGVSGGLVTGRKYQIEEQDKKRKEDAEAALKKALMDHQLSQDDFNRNNTSFDNEMALANASRSQVGRNPDGSVAYEIPGMDAATVEKMRQMLHPTTTGVPIPPAAGVVPGAPAAPALAPSPVPTAGLDPTTRSSGMIPPPAPQIQPPALPPMAAPIAGKVVNAPQPSLNITKSEFIKNPDKYRTNPNVKIVDDTEKAATAPTPASQLDSIKHLEQLLTKITPDVSTVGTVGISKILGGKRGSVGSDEAKQYEDEKPGIAVGVYRAVTGDTRLSDADAKERALPFLPSVFPTMDTDTVRKGKLATVKRALQLKAKNPNKEVPFDDIMRQAAKDVVSTGSDLHFSSEADVPKNLAKGTVIYINGRKAVID